LETVSEISELLSNNSEEHIEFVDVSVKNLIGFKPNDIEKIMNDIRAIDESHMLYDYYHNGILWVTLADPSKTIVIEAFLEGKIEA
jgi:hypothetical protein